MAPPWVGGLLVIIGTFLLLWIARLIIQGIYYWYQVGPWWLKVILFIPYVIIVIVGAMCMMSLANDVRDWWHKD